MVRKWKSRKRTVQGEEKNKYMQGCGNYYNVNQSQLFSFLPLTAFCTCLEGQVLVGSKITPFQNFPPTKLMELFFPSHLFLHNMQCPKQYLAYQYHLEREKKEFTLICISRTSLIFLWIVTVIKEQIGILSNKIHP